MDKTDLMEYEEGVDERSLRNMNKFARFMAKMIDKYGEEVLKDLQEESDDG